ncbi:MAG: ankyrin repeat domain-containing protein [Spirochaetes bacterium]|nr:ankyrin repeat domain-containing protein [Spirochaetota bacterium]
MDSNLMGNVGVHIKALRDERGLSQEYIAKQLNLTCLVISNWERGIEEPSTSQLARLAQVLEVSTDILIRNEAVEKQIVVVDTSMLIKRPAIVTELLDKFDEIVIPQVVIEELNYQKDNAKPWLRKKASLIMNVLNEAKTSSNKIMLRQTLPNDKNEIHDKQIAGIAIDLAKKNHDKVYVFAKDIYYSFIVVNKEQKNLVLLSYKDYKESFFDDEVSRDAKKSNEFINLLKNKKWENIKNPIYNNEIDINYIDPETGFTPLIQVIRYRNVEVVKFFIDKYKNIDLDLRDNHRYKFTPLLHASQLGSIEIMKLLVENGADIDAGSLGDNTGNTPLMVCAWHGFIEGAKLLIGHGACINQQERKDGYTALLKACFQGHPDVAKLLINNGADLNIRSWENKKANEYIKPNKKNASELLKLFHGGVK